MLWLTPLYLVSQKRDCVEKKIISISFIYSTSIKRFLFLKGTNSTVKAFRLKITRDETLTSTSQRTLFEILLCFTCVFISEDSKDDGLLVHLLKETTLRHSDIYIYIRNIYLLLSFIKNSINIKKPYIYFCTYIHTKSVRRFFYCICILGEIKNDILIKCGWQKRISTRSRVIYRIKSYLKCRDLNHKFRNTIAKWITMLFFLNSHFCLLQY